MDNNNGQTALVRAACYGQAECARLLLEAGAAVDARLEVELAERMGKAEMVALLEDRLSSAEKAEWEKTKAEIRLREAAGAGDADAVAALLRGGAAVDAVNEDGDTALMWAAYNGQAECARLLLEAGADATLRATGGDDEGKTALEQAEAAGEAEVAALLRG